jgi:hypothetical protein
MSSSSDLPFALSADAVQHDATPSTASTDDAVHPAAPPGVWASCLLLGIGLLFSFNVALNLIPFFSEAYGWPEFSYFAALALTWPSIFVQFLLLPFGHLLTPFSRIRGSLLGHAVILICLGTVASSSRALGLLLFVCSGVCTAVLEGSLFGWMSTFPSPRFSQAASTGVALAGMSATMLQLLLRAAMPGTLAASASAFACVGVAVLAACVVAHARLAALGAVKAWAVGAVAAAEMAGGAAACLHALRLMRLPSASLVLTFVCTFSVFPGLIATTPYRGPSAQLREPGAWFTLQLLLFGAADFGARALAVLSSEGPPPTHRALFFYALARFSLVLLLSGCAFKWPPSALFGDATFCVFVALLAGTGGHLTTLLMMHGHNAVPQKQKEAAGFVLVACLHIGIVAGSNLALGFEQAQG